MINANELRIGNKVITKKGSILTVSIIQYVINRLKNTPGYEQFGGDYFIIGFYEDKIGNLITSSKDDKVDPIPLTPAILVACGFDGEDSQNEYTLPYKMTLKNTGDYKTWRCESLSHYNLELTTLHQLQNLYFALTGKELEIKL